MLNILTPEHEDFELLPLDLGTLVSSFTGVTLVFTGVTQVRKKRIPRQRGGHSMLFSPDRQKHCVRK